MDGVLAGIRDVAIILLALLNIVLIALVVFLVWQIKRLFDLLHTQLPLVIGTVKDTTTTVQGTTEFLTSVLARPIIEIISHLRAARLFVKVIAFGQHQQRRT